jgi:PTS system N-acetylglucosamine-specific IIC component
LGPVADQVAGEIREALRATPTADARGTHAPTADAPGVLAALGGRKNVIALESLAGRLSLRVADPKAIDELGLGKLGVRGLAHTDAGSIQLLMPSRIDDWIEPLRRLIQSEQPS